jgi:hypothetical protein
MTTEPIYGIDATLNGSLEVYDGTNRPIAAALKAAVSDTVEGFSDVLDDAKINSLSYSCGELHIELRSEYDDSIIMEDAE